MSRQIVTQRDVDRANGKRFDWPLAVSPFTFRDKLSIAWWLLSQDRYTMGAKVEELEAKLAGLSGMHTLCLSSGSAANQLVFELWKLKHPKVDPRDVIVIAPAVTWISAISPAIHAGFEVRLCDVNLTDFSFDYDRLTAMLQILRDKDKRVIIWPTALIGFCPDMVRLRSLAKRYKTDLFMDSCENTLSRVAPPYIGGPTSVLASCDITTTSMYVSHQITAIEMGAIFLRHRSDYELAKLFRNHGLIRSLGPSNPTAYKYAQMDPTIDPQFCFAVPGTNLRPTDVHAMFGLRDFERVEKSLAHRNCIYKYYHDRIQDSRMFVSNTPSGKPWRMTDCYYLPLLTPSHSGFCLPIFTRGDNLAKIKERLKTASIETRPIIGSALYRQPALKGYGEPKDFPNAEWIHGHGCYVGLHGGVTGADVDRLLDILVNCV